MSKIEDNSLCISNLEIYSVVVYGTHAVKEVVGKSHDTVEFAGQETETCNTGPFAAG